VFVVAACIAALGFLLTLLLPDRPLRDTVEASGPRDHFAVPRGDDSLGELQHALSVLGHRDTRKKLYEQMAREAGIDLPALEAWTLARVEEGVAGPADALARRLDVEPERISGALVELERRSLVAPAGGWYATTPQGTALFERLVALRRERLAGMLGNLSPERHEEVAAALLRLARDLVSDPPRTAV
jgi:DNA-binding MarR family transcriptional regulator